MAVLLIQETLCGLRQRNSPPRTPADFRIVYDAKTHQHAKA